MQLSKSFRTFVGLVLGITVVWTGTLIGQRIDGGVRVNGNLGCANLTSAGDSLCKQSSSAAGVFTLVSGTGAGALTPILQFGGTTSSFPAIRRNGANFEFVLADASAYTGITSSLYAFKTNAGSASGFLLNNTATPNLMQVTGASNSTGIEYNLDAATLGACGTSPTLGARSTATSGSFTHGGATTTCVVNFTTSWTNAPNCVLTDNTTTGGAKVTAIATNSMTVTLTASDQVNWYCQGNR